MIMQIFDAHLHIVSPGFPLVSNGGYTPSWFTCTDYLRQTATLGVTGGAVVAGSFQGYDQTWLRAALACLGPAFVGVAQLPLDATADEVRSLDRAGVRGVRFNLRRGRKDDVRSIDAFARRVYDLVGWHAELYVDGTDLGPLVPVLADLPALSIDHLGLSGGGFRHVRHLAERGVRVKASGFGRVDFDVRQALRDLWHANPDCLMFGTDLPSTRAPRPFEHADLSVILDAFDLASAEQILYRNAAAFYRLNVRRSNGSPAGPIPWGAPA